MIFTRRATLRAYKPVDYLRAGQGFTKEDSNDDDYVDSPSSAVEDIALEEEDFTNLVDEDPHVLESDSVVSVPATTEDVAKGSTEDTENDLVEVLAIEHTAAAKHPDAVYSPKFSNGERSVEATVEVTTEASGIRSNESAEETKGEDAIEMDHTTSDRESSEPPSKRPNASAMSGTLFTRPHRFARRHTKTAKNRDQMLMVHKSVNNQKPGLPQTTLSRGTNFSRFWMRTKRRTTCIIASAALKSGTSTTGTAFCKFRIIVLLLTFVLLVVLLIVLLIMLFLLFTSRPGVLKIPDFLSHNFKRRWCTHAASQASRGAGRRDTDSRFTGREASFTVRSVKVVEDGTATWKVRIDAETEISLHNHKTTKAIYESYSGPKSSTLSRNVRQDLGLLTEMKTSTADINRYLADKIDIAITLQQTRNLLRHLLGSTTLERTEALLDTFADEEGNHVLFVQDQMDITCVIAMQTAVQKTCFQQWGDTLVMDWTHGTNNLGYHLGCPALLRNLVVTTATGRGIPVIDFRALDQKAVTMEGTISYFKRRNHTWYLVQTIVIDKDFVERRVLEKAFPKAKIIFFTPSLTGEKFCRPPKFNLKVTQRDVVESAFAKLIYWYGLQYDYLKHFAGSVASYVTDYGASYVLFGGDSCCVAERSNSQRSFDSELAAFSKTCEQECPELLKYFSANWESCISMWANHARGKYFSGNTTTNRIESNWNQVKLLLGKKPRLDVTITGLLSHQATIVRQLLTSIRKHSSTARQPGTIPDFLTLVSKHLSDDSLAKVRAQWDMFMAYSEEFSCKKLDASIGEWEIGTPGRAYGCNDFIWSWTCL
ncbi:LOW QUALITY PROTEIN: Hypothetical protein PHPALM_3505 [Phytophthora palmivora]|uniref:ZSWIM1/3 RNaseH-like domain-containing protein n=1 Tax=Phytophthora palmivora TaxID=4796 RepID=A0A2P4YM78_9STRA|nr:LOW QUALITY PROTEIN: Hypothetical protein PHPALM_3505 [Phytophthora palmivora]